MANPPPMSSTILYGQGCYLIVIVLLNIKEIPELQKLKNQQIQIKTMRYVNDLNKQFSQIIKINNQDKQLKQIIFRLSIDFIQFFITIQAEFSLTDIVIRHYKQVFHFQFSIWLTFFVLSSLSIILTLSTLLYGTIQRDKLHFVTESLKLNGQQRAKMCAYEPCRKFFYKLRFSSSQHPQLNKEQQFIQINRNIKKQITLNIFLCIIYDLKKSINLLIRKFNVFTKMKIDYLQDDSYNEINFQKLHEPEYVSSFIKFNKHNFNKLKNIQQKKLLHLRKKKNPLQLKQLVTKAKVNILKKNFIRKIRRGKVYNQVPNDLLVKQEQVGTTFLGRLLLYLQNTVGLSLSPVMLCIWSFINIIQISVMVIIFSIQISFPETQNSQHFMAARVFSITLYAIDMVLNFTTRRHQIVGGNKNNIKQIACFYLRNEFTFDFFSIVMFPLGYAFEANTITPFIMLIALFKLKNNLRRFQSFQFIYVKTSSRQQYYGLIKVFLLNFTIGHILSIFLNLMATLNQSGQNWYQQLGITEEQWVTKYIWGYYWGTNIMLTVGFGDISATNSTQAIILIFVQTISCITLAYNISCVGSIIGQIKAENQEKKKKLKYFHRMCEENKISEDLEHKINNFIEESYLIKEQFELEEYEHVINSLPKMMQSQYRKQANKSLFDVGFFNSLNNKTVSNLAEFVIRKVAHPQQILQKRGQTQNFCILQKGCLGFTCRSGQKSTLNGSVIQKFKIGNKQSPKILSLGFVKRKALTYDIKSLYYSIYYYLSYSQLMRILGACQMDYHFFLFMKDKNEIILGSNQIYKCKVCEDDYHTLFECPRYHYIPIRQMVLTSYLRKQAVQKVRRNSIPVRRCYRDFRTLYQASSCQQAQQRYWLQNFDEDEIRQIKNIKKYYYQKDFIAENSGQNILQLLVRNKNALEQQFQKIQDILTKVALATFEFWSVECDTAHNFKYYFKQYNPNRLIQFKTHPQKKRAKDMIFGIFAFKKPIITSANNPDNTNQKQTSNQNYQSMYEQLDDMYFGN